jgi:DNA-binding SARP family transcriptional activator
MATDRSLFAPSEARLAERPRVLSWLEATAGYRVRILCAPIGSGKSTVLREYGRHLGKRAVLVCVGRNASYDDLAAQVDAAGKGVEIMIDDLDLAPAPVVEAFVERVLAGNENTKFIVTGTSRRDLRHQVLLVRRLATAIDPTALAFDADEVHRLAVSLRVAHDADDVKCLLEETEGWPIAVDWILRDAAETHGTLNGATEAWCETRGHLLLEFLDQKIAFDTDAHAAFSALLQVGAVCAGRELERLEALGLPIHGTRRTLRPNPLMMRLASSEGAVPVAPEPVGPLMRVRAFGLFRCDIAGKPLGFCRRRDKNVFAYVALARDGRASREELLAALWPGVSRIVATQGLRTTLSRIRRSIGDIVGAGNVDRYFSTAGDIRINPALTTLDVQRFAEHLDHAHLEEARGASASARSHYAAAVRLYGPGLLASEPLEVPFVDRIANAEAHYIEALIRLVEIHTRRGENDRARIYAQQILERSQDAEQRGRAVRVFAGTAAR